MTEPVALYQLVGEWLKKDAGWDIIELSAVNGLNEIFYTTEAHIQRFADKEYRWPIAEIFDDRVHVRGIRWKDDAPSTSSRIRVSDGVTLVASDPDFFFKLDEALKTVCFCKSEWFQCKDKWSGKRGSWEV